MISAEFKGKLSWYVEPDSDEWVSFNRTVSFIVESVIAVKNAPPEPSMAESKKRINKVKKAFSQLTVDDRWRLDIASGATWMLLDAINDLDTQSVLIRDVLKGGLFPLCETMEKALEKPLSSRRKSKSRSLLKDFARIAIRKDWISTDNATDLTELLALIIEETGVKHDARDIALEALKIAEKS